MLPIKDKNKLLHRFNKDNIKQRVRSCAFTIVQVSYLIIFVLLTIKRDHFTKKQNLINFDQALAVWEDNITCNR